MLSPLSDAESPLHAREYANPFEIGDEDQHVTIEADDNEGTAASSVSATNDTVKSSGAPSSTKPSAAKSTAAATTINIEAPTPVVTGAIGSGTSGRTYYNDTLDEPVSETLLRDLRNVALKLRQVLHPKARRDVLRDWDLWGPLVLCLAMAIMLSFKAKTNQEVLVFTGVFVIVWLGATVVTVNAKLLGGSVSFFQSVCVLGYCTFPLVIANVITLFVDSFFIRLPFVIVAYGWACFASVNFLSHSQISSRRVLVLYPLFLFYFCLAWLILIISPK